MLSRLIHGARIALTVAVVAATLGAPLGTVLGLAAGYFGGWVDCGHLAPRRHLDGVPARCCSRSCWSAIIGAGLHSVILAIVVIDWTRFCRVVRAEAMRRRGSTMSPPRGSSASPAQPSILREVLPNVPPLLVALLSLEMGIAVIVEAILSFVGLSVSTDTPTWGGMIAEGRQIMHQACGCWRSRCW